MAKKKGNVAQDSFDDDFDSFAKKADDSVIGGKIDSAQFGKIDHYIDTGSYALNRLISGSIFGGIPNNKVIGFIGKSSTGKSFVCGRIIKNAIKMGYRIVHLNTEEDTFVQVMENMGCDMSKVRTYAMTTITQTKNWLINTLGPLKEKHPDVKVLVVLDSYAGLNSSKEINDTLEGKSAQDMGLRAKEGKQLFSQLTKFCGRNSIPFIYTNHIYEQPPANPKAPPVIKQSGGEAPTYMASAVVFMRKLAEKDLNTKEITANKIYCRTEKNRLCKEGATADLYLSMTTGPNRYYGLLEDAVEAKLLDGSSSGYYIPLLEGPHQGKKLRESQIFKYSKEIFTQEFLEKLDEYCKKVYLFPKVSDDSESVVDDVIETDVIDDTDQSDDGSEDPSED
jgi:RecA/RadA recombinase